MMRTLLYLAACMAAFGQDADRTTLNFADPNGAKTLIANVFHGNLTITAHAGKEVIVEARGSRLNRSRREPPTGMRRIGGDEVSLGAQQSGNEIRVNLGVFDHGDVNIQVPADTALKLRTTTGGDITVDGVTGEIEANSLNGQVRVTNAAGPIVASSHNGKILVTLTQAPNKPMSFSSFNGDVDVTLPAAVKADLSMKSARGDIFSDFDIALKASPTPTGTRVSGKYKVRFDRAVLGSINGGGPEIQFTTYNGAVYIRKK